MCLSWNKLKTLTAKENKRVFKVLRRLPNDDNLRLLFNDGKGKKAGLVSVVDETLFEPLLGTEAIGFEDGFGFHCFENSDRAYRYIEQVKAEKWHDYGLCVVEVFIPKGARFHKGTIKGLLIGWNMKALAAEKLSGPIEVLSAS